MLLSEGFGVIQDKPEQQSSRAVAGTEHKMQVKCGANNEASVNKVSQQTLTTGYE